MNKAKRNNFVVMTFFLGAGSLFYFAVNASMAIDYIIAIMRDTHVYSICSGWLDDFKDGIVVLFALAFALTLIIAALAFLFYRKELSRKTLGLLYSFPLISLAWNFIYFIPAYMFLHYDNDSPFIALICDIVSAVMIAVYAGFTLKNMIEEIRND